ncbi:DUF5655 domain-containing protein [Phenylobacterium sp.]|uniref:DUF5655 domain-containing protein n=1 Tax=Phenylobacterium sp. TaxID=1871053 RepID=UPI0035691161
MASLEQAVATFERNIATQTGATVEDWIVRVRATDLARHGEMVAWLKSAHGLGHGHANHIAKRALSVGADAAGEDGVGHLFEGPKAALRPLYDAVVASVTALGPDVELAPKKANVSVRRSKQFALLQPSTAARLDLGLILKGRPPKGRLEASGSFNAMFTHRVRLAGPADLDAEVKAWLKAAYDGAA